MSRPGCTLCTCPQGPCSKAVVPAFVCEARGTAGGPARGAPTQHCTPRHHAYKALSVLRPNTGALPKEPMREAGSALATFGAHGGHMFGHKRSRAPNTLGLNNQTAQLVTACVPVCQPRSPSHCRLPSPLIFVATVTRYRESPLPHTHTPHADVVCADNPRHTPPQRPHTFASHICLTTPMTTPMSTSHDHVQPCVAQGLLLGGACHHLPVAQPQHTPPTLHT